MAYENFSVEKVEADFSVKIKDVPDLFEKTPTTTPSERLISLLADFVPLGSAIGTEKARSEFIIAPILAEVKKLTNKIIDNQVSLFSGNKFDVDKDKGLNGFCDFMFSFSSSQLSISAPVMAIVEAKNENINSGFGQCMAEMIAAQIYNEQKNKAVSTLYGCVTTGSVWKFLKLNSDTIYLDNTEYYLDQLAKILGIFVNSLNEVIDKKT